MNGPFAGGGFFGDVVTVIVVVGRAEDIGVIEVVVEAGREAATEGCAVFGVVSVGSAGSSIAGGTSAFAGTTSVFAGAPVLPPLLFAAATVAAWDGFVVRMASINTATLMIPSITVDVIANGRSHLRRGRDS